MDTYTILNGNSTDDYLNGRRERKRERGTKRHSAKIYIVRQITYNLTMTDPTITYKYCVGDPKEDSVGFLSFNIKMIKININIKITCFKRNI